MISNTIIAAPIDPAAQLRPLVIQDAEHGDFAELEAGQRLFKIRAANSDGYRSSANILVSRMYAWRGYQTNSAVGNEAPNRITLVAVGHDETIGTISVGFDGPEGMFVDDLFRREVDAVRDEGRTLCEFTKLAVDSMVRSKRVLASLFHVAYIYAHRLNRIDDLLIEVNPRHVRYYERMLGFRVMCEQRINRRVNAPAVLMCLDFSHAREQINRFGGNPHLGCEERSLYPYFFSVSEEAGIVGRLLGKPRDTAARAPGHGLSLMAS